MLALSIPEAIPYIIIAKVSASATMCHPTFPKGPAVELKASTYPSTFCASNTEPVMEPTKYFSIQPTTTEYPIAKARLPRTGIRESTSPRPLPFAALSVALPKAPIGPAPIARPKAISPTTPVKPITITQIKYGIKNAAPPRADTLAGNSQILPMPTAEPMQAMMKPVLLLKLSLSAIFSIIFLLNLLFYGT